MQRITRELARKYAFDFRDEPLLRVRPGESFEIETYDASTGYFKTPEDKAIPGKRPGRPRAARRIFEHAPGPSGTTRPRTARTDQSRTCTTVP